VDSLKQKYQGIDVPFYKLREMFSKTHQVFFDCEEPNKQACLEKILRKTDYEAFMILFVAKEPSGTYRFMDASFKNIRAENLEHFITRFHSQLESMTKLGIQATGLEYLECAGHSYVEPLKQS
jgi:hypothetical protein